MLYVTTRNCKDAFTVNRCLSTDTAPDGGCFSPMRIPTYEGKEIAALKDKSFSQILAEVLNKFFSSRLTAWDVELSLGKNASRIDSLSHKITIAELWRNPTGNFDYITQQMYAKIASNPAKPSLWFKVAMRIAVFFGTYGQILNADLITPDKTFDISLSADDFTSPIAALYARQMGLPIGTIICTYENNSNVWDLIHRGIFNTASVDDVLRLGVEQMIYITLSYDAVTCYQQACDAGKVFSLDEEQLAVLNKGLFCAVAGTDRREAVINSVFRSNSYIIDPFAALSYGGVQDYRARVGESRMTLLLAERTPLDFSKEISAATGITADKLMDHIKLS